MLTNAVVSARAFRRAQTGVAVEGANRGRHFEVSAALVDIKNIHKLPRVLQDHSYENASLLTRSETYI